MLVSWLSTCCALYNAALQHRRDAWEHEKTQRRLAEDRGIKRERAKAISYNAQTTELTVARAADADLAAVPIEVSRSPLRRIDRAYKAFFRRCKSGETPGHPRFRSWRRYDSFEIGRIAPCDRGDSKKKRGTRSAHVRIPNLGLVKFHEYRSLQGRVLSTTVRRTPTGKWFVCFSCDLGAAPEKKPVASATGVDVGLAAFATLSNGEAIDAPKFFHKSEAQLALRQQRVSRRFRRGKKQTASFHRARVLVARTHEHIKNQRLDFARKLACALFLQYDLVAYEDLNIRGMVRGNFSKSINDAAWGLFVHALTCKAESAGRWAVAVDPRGTTIRCSGCGASVPKTLSQREHLCSCGVRMGRDENAAKNILALGRSAVSAPALAG